MILPPPTDYLRAFAMVFVAGILSGFAVNAFGQSRYRQGLGTKT